jgi:hypothetical protein
LSNAVIDFPADVRSFRLIDTIGKISDVRESGGDTFAKDNLLVNEIDAEMSVVESFRQANVQEVAAAQIAHQVAGATVGPEVAMIHV